MSDFFIYNRLQLKSGDPSQSADAALGALLFRYLRQTYTEDIGAWESPSGDDRATVRYTCQALEILYQLDFDPESSLMVTEASNWLINLPPHRDHITADDRKELRLYASRFKTLAMVQRFDDEVRRDFKSLLDEEDGGVIRYTGQSSILMTCVVLETLLILEQQHDGIVDRNQCHRIARRLCEEIRKYYSKRRNFIRNRPLIKNLRDLSYVFGLLSSETMNVELGSATLQRYLASAKKDLIARLDAHDWSTSEDHSQALYAAIQLAQCAKEDPAARSVLEKQVTALQKQYALAQVRDWDFLVHTLVLRLLLSYKGVTSLKDSMVLQLLREVEDQYSREQSPLVSELRGVVDDHMKVRFDRISEISGGLSQDNVYRVDFTYWFPSLALSANPPDSANQMKLIVKRSTQDAFNRAVANYSKLPSSIRHLFVSLPTQVTKSRASDACFLIMEDLTELYTLHYLLRRWDQRNLSPAHSALLDNATKLICSAVCDMFSVTLTGKEDFHRLQLSRLYLSSIEHSLTRAVSADHVPWLKTPLQHGCYINHQEYRRLDYYLGAITNSRSRLEPPFLGLTHGDLHSRNVMLDKSCTRVKLIDLDKLSWTEDYLADFGALLESVTVFRRLHDGDQSYAIEMDRIVLDGGDVEGKAQSESGIRYPPLLTPITARFQKNILARLERFAEDRDDREWKARLWLATAASLLRRLSFQTRKETAAVMYGEGIRLLHELCLYLERDQTLPESLFPLKYLDIRLRENVSLREALPEWCRSSERLVALHEQLLKIGLHSSRSDKAVRYYVENPHVLGSDVWVATLAPGKGDSLAALFLRLDDPTRIGSNLVRVLAEPRGDRGLLRSVIDITTGVPIDGVISIVSTSIQTLRVR